jgi:hypothetical protein
MEGVPLPPSLYRGAADEMGKCQTFHKEKFHTGLAGPFLGQSGKKEPRPIRRYRPLDDGRLGHVHVISSGSAGGCGNLTTLRAVEVAGSAEAQPLRELSVSWARGLR